MRDERLAMADRFTAHAEPAALLSRQESRAYTPVVREAGEVVSWVPLCMTYEAALAAAERMAREKVS